MLHENMKFAFYKKKNINGNIKHTAGGESALVW